MEERGRVVGDYMLGERIGSGSFAVVWRARHRQSGAEVAVKEIDKMKVDGKFREGLLKEITILRNISHPNIVRLYQAIQVSSASHFLSRSFGFFNALAYDLILFILELD